MGLNEMFLSGGGIVLVLLTLIQITPIKINPWTKIGNMVGKCFNAEITKELQEIKATLDETQKSLQEHIIMDDIRDTDEHRYKILKFNTELLRNMKHTEEDFNEVLYNIDCYEHYCSTHPNYKNNRCVMAIKNITHRYQKCMRTGDFLHIGFIEDEDEE